MGLYYFTQQVQIEAKTVLQIPDLGTSGLSVLEHAAQEELELELDYRSRSGVAVAAAVQSSAKQPQQQP